MPEMAAARAATPLAATVQTVDGPFDLIDAPEAVRAGDTLIAVISGGDTAHMDITGGNPWILQDEAGGTRVYTQVAPPDNPTTYAVHLSDDAHGLCALLHLRGATPAGMLLVSDSGSGIGGPDAIAPDASPGAAGGIAVRYVTGSAASAPTWQPGSGYTVDGQAANGNTSVWIGASTMLSSAGLPEAHITSTGVLVWRAWTLVVLAGDYVPPPPPLPAFTPAAGAALFRVTAHDFPSGEYRDDLYPAEGWTYDKRLNEPGAFSGTLPIPNKRVAQAVRRIIPRFKSDLTTGPGRIEIRIWMDGVLQPRYWLTGARLSMGRDGKISAVLRGSTMDSYFYSVRVRQDLSYSGDQVANVRSFLTHGQAQPGADIGMLFQSGSSGVSRPLTVKADSGTTYGRAAQEYARTSGGFETVVNETVGASGVESTWVWAYPQIGTGTKHVFTSSPHGGEIPEWSLDIDALRGGTDIQVRGGTPETDATEQRSPMYSAMVTTPHRAAGFPRIDKMVDHPTQSTDQTSLDAYAQHVADISGGALWVRTVTVYLGKHASLTMQKLGDYARLVMTDVWHEREDGGAGLDESERVIGMQIRGPARGRGKTEATLVLASEAVT